MTTRLARRKSFQCMHRYAVESWSEQKNAATFGPCFSPHGHGHNYDLEAYFTGPVDPETGMIANLVDVDHWLNEVIRPIDGKHLNFEVPEFAQQVPTTEAIANYLWTKLHALKLPAGVEISNVRLYESDDLWVDVWP